DSDVTTSEVNTGASSFLDRINFDELRTRTRERVILLTHLPLYWEDDLQCGDVRRREVGHVTYEAHAWCAYQHPATMEHTVPTFLWGQRPDPSCVLLRLPRTEPVKARQPEVTMCHLPKEPFIFVTYAAIIVVAHGVRFSRRLRVPKVKTKGA
ncbi:Metallophosphoesterase 1, partial [Phytophthora megakarya]